MNAVDAILAISVLPSCDEGEDAPLAPWFMGQIISLWNRNYMNI